MLYAQLGVTLFLASICLSPLTVIAIGVLDKAKARRVVVLSLCLLGPMLLGSGVWFLSLGERGFLSDAQGWFTLCVFLIGSVGLGYLVARLRANLSASGRGDKRL